MLLFLALTGASAGTLGPVEYFCGLAGTLDSPPRFPYCIDFVADLGERNDLRVTVEDDLTTGFWRLRVSDAYPIIALDGCSSLSPTEATCRVLAPDGLVLSVFLDDQDDDLDLVDAALVPMPIQWAKAFGGDGDDHLSSDGNFYPLFYGESGQDVLTAALTKAWLDGGDGDDLLFGGPEGDRLNGGPGDDLLDAKAGSDQLNGGPGRDELRAGPGADLLDAEDRTLDLLYCGIDTDPDLIRVDLIDSTFGCP